MNKLYLPLTNLSWECAHVKASEYNKKSIPYPGIKAQQISTKVSANLYYSHRNRGGWKVLNAKTAANEIEGGAKA